MSIVEEPSCHDLSQHCCASSNRIVNKCNSHWLNSVLYIVVYEYER